jgi:hypothetical protein
MNNAIKVQLQMQNGFLQLESTLGIIYFKIKIHQHCISPRKYNRQRRQLLFLVSEKSVVMKENC